MGMPSPNKKLNMFQFFQQCHQSTCTDCKLNIKSRPSIRGLKPIINASSNMKNIEPKMSVDTFKYVQLGSWKPETNVLMCVTEMVPKRNCAT